MPYRHVTDLRFKDAVVQYRAKDGKNYELPGTYQGSYPGATTDSQSVELDSTSITLAGQPTPQQMSVQLPASDHPAAKDMFAAQADPDPRRLSVALQPRTLYTKPSEQQVQIAIASGAITISGRGYTTELSEAILPINAVIVTGSAGSEKGALITGGKFSVSAGTGLTTDAADMNATDIVRIIAPGLMYGPFLADINTVDLTDDSGVAMYALNFTPTVVVPAPARLLSPVGQQ